MASYQASPQYRSTTPEREPSSGVGVKILGAAGSGLSCKTGAKAGGAGTTRSAGGAGIGGSGVGSSGVGGSGVGGSGVGAAATGGAGTAAGS